MELEEENCLSYLWLNIVSALPLCPLRLRYNAAFSVLQSTHKAPAVRERGAFCAASFAVLQLSDTEQNNTTVHFMSGKQTLTCFDFGAWQFFFLLCG